MIRFLKNNQIQTLLAVILLISGLYWVLYNFGNPKSLAETYPIPQFFQQLFTSSLPAWLDQTLCFALILIQSMLFGSFVERYQILHKSTWLPSLFFALFCMVFPAQLQLNGTLLANVFMVVSFTFLFRSQGKEKAMPELINTGFCLGLASFFAPEVILFLPVIVFGMYAFKPGRTLDLLQLIAGLTFPWYFLFGLDFTFGWRLSLSGYWSQEFLAAAWPDWLSDLNTLIFFSGLALLFIFILIQVQQNFFRNTIRARKYQQFILLYFLSSLILSVISRRPFEETLVYLAAPLSVYLTYYFLPTKRKFLREVIFYLIIAGIFMVQFQWI